MTPKRTRPLSAADVSGVSPDDVMTDAELAAADEAVPGAGPDAAQARHERFRSGVAGLRVGGAGSLMSERLLLFLAGIVAPLGVVIVILGWRGASNTPYQFEQVPYLISGGLLGLALVFLGGFFYFAHWMTQLVKEHREQSRAILAALERISELEQAQLDGVATNGRAASRAS